MKKEAAVNSCGFFWGGKVSFKENYLSVDISGLLLKTSFYRSLKERLQSFERSSLF
jgi:hypothetical protein